jgi:hypothetical protein
MTKCVFLFALVSTLLFVGVAGAQHPLLDKIADKVVQSTSNRPVSNCGRRKRRRKASRNPRWNRKPSSCYAAIHS